jgi:hypothetical protein
MGRPRQYANAAERQRAYRERLEEETVRVNRRALEQLETRVDALYRAVRAASRAGDSLAAAWNEGSEAGMLARMTSYFEGKVADGGTAKEEQTRSRRKAKS